MKTVVCVALTLVKNGTALKGEGLGVTQTV